MYAFKFVPKTGTSTDNIMNLLKVSSAPVIQLPEEVVDATALGDSTKMYRHTGVYDNREIELECNFVRQDKRQWLDTFTKIKRYFGNGEGTLQLLSDDQEHYFKVKATDISVDSRFAGRDSEFSITFTCDPYRYFLKYQKPTTITSDSNIEIYNYYESATPTFRIYNTSQNATTLTINVNDNVLTIDKPFESVTYTDDVDYIEINTEDMYMKTVYVTDKEEYTTAKTSGSFYGLQLVNGYNDVKLSVDIGSITCDLYRNFREL